MRSTILAVLVSAVLCAAGPAAQTPEPRAQSTGPRAQGPEPRGQGQQQTFSGTITDSICATGGHAQMRMGPTDADCTTACVTAHDARYVLAEGKEIYGLSDQRTPEKLAGQKVRVVGSLDTKTKTIHVVSITAAK